MPAYDGRCRADVSQQPNIWTSAASAARRPGHGVIRSSPRRRDRFDHPNLVPARYHPSWAA